MPDTSHPAESNRVDNRGILLFGFALAISTILIAIGVWGFFHFLKGRQDHAGAAISPRVAASLKRTPPEPRLEPDPLAPRRAYLAGETAILSSYGWVDRSNDSVRIPIDRAMAIIASRGVPGGKPLPAGMAAAPVPAATPIPLP